MRKVTRIIFNPRHRDDYLEINKKVEEELREALQDEGQISMGKLMSSLGDIGESELEYVETSIESFEMQEIIEINEGTISRGPKFSKIS